jgi:hypothetical protein
MLARKQAGSQAPASAVGAAAMATADGSTLHEQAPPPVTRALICAQSNAAVDELVSRLGTQVCLPVWLCLCLSLHLSACPSVCPSVRPSDCLDRCAKRPSDCLDRRPVCPALNLSHKTLNHKTLGLCHASLAVCSQTPVANERVT